MLTVDPWFWYYAAVLVLVIPARWLIAAALAALFHELCHILAILLLGEQIHGIRLRILGIRIETSFSHAGKELLAALAGPAGSLSLLLFCHVWPCLALWGFVQGVFNLLPVYPMDGGRVLRCVLTLLRRKIPCKGRANAVQ